jgi:formylglycine-generating enzyme required for sulfatase activity
VTASGDRTARIWDVATGRLLQTLHGHEAKVTSATFSPDGARIVTASEDRTARVWDVASGRLLQTLQGHENWVESATFSPDGVWPVRAKYEQACLFGEFAACAGPGFILDDQRCPAEMAFVQGGRFLMGSPDGQGEADEHPQHPVVVPSFCMDRTEATVAHYAECVAAGGCTPGGQTVSWRGVTAEDHTRWDRNCNARPDRAGRENHPMNCIDWEQARAFCAWRCGVARADVRLPSEAQWEFAASGGGTRAYPWGDEAPNAQLLNACGVECDAVVTRRGLEWGSMYTTSDGFEDTAAVGSFPRGATPEGLLDLSGNVWEWTADWYATSYASTSRVSEFRVFRGGGWNTYDLARVRARYRDRDGPSYRVGGLGLRCVAGGLTPSLLPVHPTTALNLSSEPVGANEPDPFGAVPTIAEGPTHPAPVRSPLERVAPETTNPIRSANSQVIATEQRPSSARNRWLFDNGHYFERRGSVVWVENRASDPSPSERSTFMYRFLEETPEYVELMGTTVGHVIRVRIYDNMHFVYNESAREFHSAGRGRWVK